MWYDAFAEIGTFLIGAGAIVSSVASVLKKTFWEQLVGNQRVHIFFSIISMALGASVRLSKMSKYRVRSETPKNQRLLLGPTDYQSVAFYARIA